MSAQTEASHERGCVREAGGGVQNRRIRELRSMVSEFVARTRRSRWQSALPTGSRCVQAQPARQLFAID